MYVASQSQALNHVSQEKLVSMASDPLMVIKPNEAIISKEDVAKFKQEYYLEQQVPATMAMGYRYSEGIAGFETNCEAAFLYFEPAAYQTVLHVSDTHGLDTVQFKKLDFGQYILDKELQIDENTQIEMKGATNDDIEQMIEFQGSYGDAQSLSFKG